MAKCRGTLPHPSHSLASHTCARTHTRLSKQHGYGVMASQSSRTLCPYCKVECMQKLTKSVKVITSDIIFQHPVALTNNLIYRGILEGANSCHACRLLVCYIVTCL
jgi:hypothetical protein